MGIKLTKQDYMRLSKERLAELLAEMDNSPVQPIVLPAPSCPSIPNTSPWGPVVTYTEQTKEVE